MKKRVLLCGEFTQLKTGYANYQYELLSRLYSDYDVAEHASSVKDGDPRIKDIPWKVYGNSPQNPQEESLYNQDIRNQFGKFRFTNTLLEFKPHVVLSILDPWMSDFILRHPYRKLYKFAWMATVDAYPLKPEWLYDLSEVDAVFTYNDWAKSVLNGYGVDVFASAPYGMKFKILNKTSLKKQFGIDKKLIGFVSRNQKRKLFPALFRSFSKFLSQSPDKNYALYLHTSYPDNAQWEIPNLLQEYGIGNNVYFTYLCRETGQWFPRLYSGPITENPNTHKYTLFFPNVNCGLPDSEMNKVYALFDLYIQLANMEGFGLGQVDAASAGVPVMATDYSAMTDVVRKLEGIPIKVCNLSRELETNREMAIPDEEHLVSELLSFFSLPDSIRANLGFKSRKAAEKHYSWDIIVDNWKRYIDSVDLNEGESRWKTSNRSSAITQVNGHLNNKKFLRECITNVLCDESKKNTMYEAMILQALNNGYMNQEPYSRDKLVQYFASVNNTFNTFEGIRCKT